jgi:nucleosome binding factor SPN SPT16 subunit
MDGVTINAERFFQRVTHLQTHWLSHKDSEWGSSDAICIPFGATGAEDELLYSKSQSMHLYLLGYEFSDSIILITKDSFYFMATQKKCAILEKSLSGADGPIKVNFLYKEKDEGVNRENFHKLHNIVRKSGTRLGSLYKAEYRGNFIQSWMDLVKSNQFEMVEISSGIALLLSVKDEAEQVSKASSIYTIIYSPIYLANFEHAFKMTSGLMISRLGFVLLLPCLLT